jgi:putative molybdopterin biosynthesis protein
MGDGPLMDDARLHSGLRELPVKAGLQQQELARLAGVTRQTLGALEAGESVPATSIALQLARALGCRVEDIFWLGEEARPLEAVLVGRPGAGGDGDGNGGAQARRRVALAVVDGDGAQGTAGRWVAHLLDGEATAAFAAPADGVVDRPARREGGARARRKSPAPAPALTPAPPPAPPSLRVRPLRAHKDLRENLFAAGCDPALALLAGHIGERWKEGRLHWLEAGSGAALDMLAERNVAPRGGAPARRGERRVQRRAGPAAAARAGGAADEPRHLGAGAGAGGGQPQAPAWRGRPGPPRGADGRARARQRVTRAVLAAGRRGRPAAQGGGGVTTVARGHMAVAQAVAAGAADAGIATRAAAASHGLAFVPLAEARFDLVVARDSAGEPRLERLFQVLASQRFKRDLGGHGLGARAGRVRGHADVRRQPAR